MGAKTRNQQEAQMTRTRAERLLIDLEKLKSDISRIENRFGVLSVDYTTICEDAISRLNSIREDLDTSHEPERKDNDDDLRKRIQNLEARFRLGLITRETYLNQREKLVLRHCPPSTGVQLAIDKVADGIEYGLDKLGDGLIFPIVLVVHAYSGIKNQIRK